MQRVALTRIEIESLPDNFIQANVANSFPHLPADLFKGDGPWVCLCFRGGEPMAPKHTDEFSGRSVFLAFIRLPNGREETLAYLKRLGEFADPWVLTRDPFSQVVAPNPALPQFPPGTQLALVRQLLLLDQDGEVIPTHLTESVQIRIFRTISASTEPKDTVDTAEFRLSREKLFAHQAGGLSAIGSNEKKLSVFMTHGEDQLEQSDRSDPLEAYKPVLQTCANCHSGNGVHSVLTYTHALGQFYARLPELVFRQQELTYWSVGNQASATADWKERQHDMGLLQGLWMR
jgi:hypothetical protein